MKNIKKYLLLALISVGIVSCSEDSIPVANDITLEFNNTFGDATIVLGDEASTDATVNTSTQGQEHHFSELKYVISNIVLINEEGLEFPYNVNNLDEGATIIDQAKPETFQYVLNDIPTANYTEIKFGLGIKSDLNTLNEEDASAFYAATGAHDTALHWYWGTGYRFTKIEGFYGADNTPFSIHTGSTDGSSAADTVDAYREITLNLTTSAKVGSNSPKIKIKADFKNLLSGIKKISLTPAADGYKSGSAPSIHSDAVTMVQYIDNIGGNGDTDIKGMFSIETVEN